MIKNPFPIIDQESSLTFIVNILIIFLASCTIFPDNKDAVEMSESRLKLHQILEESFDYLKVPGICVGLWTKDREVFSGCKGKSKKNSDLEMDSQNYIRIGSITKTFTATLMMILSEKKYFSLDFIFGVQSAPFLQPLIQNPSLTPFILR